MQNADTAGTGITRRAIAVPLAWYAIGRWMQDFAYRTSMPWWIFVLAGVAAVAIALVTVSYQAIRAATANPVKSLRSAE